MENVINHPNHYNIEGRKECIVEMEDIWGIEAVITFCILNAYKYRYRAGVKSQETLTQDLKKADWYEAYAEKLKKKLDEKEGNV